MQITEIKLRLMDEERLKAFASVTFDDCFVVHNMKVIKGEKGLMLCMPSRKLLSAQHRDLVHPITRQFREYLESKVLEVYHNQCLQAADKSSEVSASWEGVQQLF